MNLRERSGPILAVTGLVALLLASVHHPLLTGAFRKPFGWPAVHPGILLAHLAQSAACFLASGAMVLGWWATGRRVRQWLGSTSGAPWLDLIAGMLVVSVALQGVGVAGLIHRPVLAALMLIMLGTVVPWRAWRSGWTKARDWTREAARPGLALLPALPWLLTAPLLPPTNVDMLEYHFGVPVLWNAAHRIYAQSANLLFTMPLGIERLALPWLVWDLPGAAVAQTIWLLAAAALAFAAALRRAGSPAAAAGGWVIAGCGAALMLAADGHPDTALLLAAAAGCLVAAGAGGFTGPGLVTALACAAKYQGAVLAVALTLATAPPRRIGRWIGGVAAIWIAASMPWLMFNVLATGNPVYPFLSHLLPSLHWADWNTEALWSSMANASIVIERGFPEDTARQFLLAFWRGTATVWVAPFAVLVYLMPLLVMLRGSRVRRRLALVALLCAAAWVWPVPKFGRYLLPGLVPAVGAWWLAWPARWSRAAQAAAGLLACLGAIAFIGQARATPVAPESVLTGAVGAEGFREAAEGGYRSAARWVSDQARRGERTLVIGQGNGWGLPAPWLANNECGLPAWFSAAGAWADPGRMRVTLRQAGIRWIVYDPVRAVSRSGYALGLDVSDRWLRAYADLWRRWIDVAREPDRFDATGVWYVYRVRDAPHPPRPHPWLPGAERLLPDEAALRRGEDQRGRLEVERRYLPDFGITAFHASMEAWAGAHDARRAEAGCREAIRRGLSLPAVFNSLGFYLWQQHRYEEAAQWLRRSLALDPGNAVAAVNLAETLPHLRRP